MRKEHPEIITVDDDLSIMRCVGHVLEKETGIRVVGQATHALAGLAMAVLKQPDLVLMDIHMPGGSPFTACRKIMEEQCAKVLFFTGFPRDLYLDQARSAGASGIISKHTASIAELGIAIRYVLMNAENFYYSPELVNRMVELEEGAPQSRLSTVTHREIEVLQLIGAGKTQSEIAQELDLSDRTIHKEVNHLKSKLDISTVRGLMCFAITEGVFHPELQPM